MNMRRKVQKARSPGIQIHAQRHDVPSPVILESIADIAKRAKLSKDYVGLVQWAYRRVAGVWRYR
jgi:hypothetical protein